MASVPGGIVLPQLVHVTNVIVAVFSLIAIPRWMFVIVTLPYILYVSKRKNSHSFSNSFVAITIDNSSFSASCVKLFIG